MGAYQPSSLRRRATGDHEVIACVINAFIEALLSQPAVMSSLLNGAVGEGASTASALAAPHLHRLQVS